MIVLFTSSMHTFFILYIYFTPLHVLSTIVFIFRRTVVLVQHVVLSLSLGDSSDHLWSELSPKENDDTRCCTNKIVLMKISIA